jgi:mono/diheme cytochrome c family protein
MYPIVLFTHSWLRWLVLLASLYVIARTLRGVTRGAPWQPADRLASNTLLHLANLQFTLGLLLYVWLSPIVRSAFANIAVAMRSAPLRFFLVEHITAMLIGVSLLNIGVTRAKRAQLDARRHRSVLFGALGFLLLALIGIPWPELKHGRPLARTQLFESEAAQGGEAPELYGKRCAACHGAFGRGDGLAAAAMQPRPRDFADARWQKSVSDAELTQVIQQGGLSRQLSASMPPHSDLSAAQLAELVAFVRGVPAGAGRPTP